MTMASWAFHQTYNFFDLKCATTTQCLRMLFLIIWAENKAEMYYSQDKSEKTAGTHGSIKWYLGD